MENDYKTFQSNGLTSRNNNKTRITNDLTNLQPDPGTYTVEEAIEKIGFGRFQIKVSFVAGLAWIADSMELMVLSILGPVLVCQWQLSTTKEAFITTVVFIGFSMGSPVMGWLADKYGRKTSLMMAAAWAAFYGILSASAPIYAWLLILRGLTGVGLAGVPQAVTYYSEFLPGETRGKCIILLEVFWAFGAVFEVILAIIIMEPLGWNWWLVASSLPLIIFIPSVMTLPESPRYLLAAGDTQGAQESLAIVAKTNKKSLPPGTLRPEPQSERAQFKDLLTPEYKRSSILLWVLWFVCTFSYYGIILLSTELIQAGTTCIRPGAGLELPSDSAGCVAGCKTLSSSDFIQLLWTSVAEIPGLILTAIYIDYIGRRTAMCINLVLYSLCMFLLFICASNVFLIVMLFCGRALIASALQVAFVYTPELYPTTVRAIGIGTANVFARTGAIITPFVAEVLSHHNFAAAISVYGVLGLFAAGMALLLPIETKGKAMQSSAH